MRRIEFLIAILFTVAVGACGGSSSAPTTCGAGTHDNGNSVCVKDSALYLVNASGTYWSCPDSGNRGAFYALVFASSTTTSGTGTYAANVNSTWNGVGGSPFTWTEDATAMTMTLTNGNSLAPFKVLNGIVLNANDTSYTANCGNIGCNDSGTLTRL